MKSSVGSEISWKPAETKAALDSWYFTHYQGEVGPLTVGGASRVPMQGISCLNSDFTGKDGGLAQGPGASRLERWSQASAHICPWVGAFRHDKKSQRSMGFLGADSVVLSAMVCKTDRSQCNRLLPKDDKARRMLFWTLLLMEINLKHRM